MTSHNQSLFPRRQGRIRRERESGHEVGYNQSTQPHAGSWWNFGGHQLVLKLVSMVIYQFFFPKKRTCSLHKLLPTKKIKLNEPIIYVSKGISLPFTPISGKISCLLYRKISLLVSLSFFSGASKLGDLCFFSCKAMKIPNKTL